MKESWEIALPVSFLGANAKQREQAFARAYGIDYGWDVNGEDLKGNNASGLVYRINNQNQMQGAHHLDPSATCCSSAAPPAIPASCSPSIPSPILTSCWAPLTRAQGQPAGGPR